MTTLSEIGIPGAGSGILQPNVRHHFQIRFLDVETGEKLAVSDTLSNQVIRTSNIVYQSEDQGHRNTMQLTLQDDILNHAFKGMLELSRIKYFNIAVDILDGCSSIVRSTILNKASILVFSHGNLDYASSMYGRDVEIDAHFPEHVGKITSIIEENPIGAAILHALGGAYIKIGAGRNISENAACQIYANFVYESQSFEFIN